MKLTAMLATLSLAGALLAGAAADPVVVKAADVKCVDHPFVKGGQMAVQSGDPSKGPSVILMRFPKVMTIAPHTHTSDETVTIVAGSAVFGGGETVDLSKGVEVGPGAYAVIPGKAPHWGVVKEDLVFTVTLNLPADFHLCGQK